MQGQVSCKYSRISGDSRCPGGSGLLSFGKYISSDSLDMIKAIARQDYNGTPMDVLHV